MSDKMCTVQDALDAGYTSSVGSSVLGGGGKCLTVNRFLQYFSKDGYELSVPWRSSYQLFPLSGVRTQAEPSLAFDKTSITVEDDIPTAVNAFQYESLQAPWTVEILNPSIQGHATASVDSASGEVSVELVPNTTDNNFTCTVRLTGTRVNGGTLSAEFTLVQLSLLILATVTIENNTSSVLNLKIRNNYYVVFNSWSSTTVLLSNRETSKDTAIASGYTDWFQITYNDVISYTATATDSNGAEIFEKQYGGNSDKIDAGWFKDYWYDPYQYNIFITADS